MMATASQPTAGTRFRRTLLSATAFCLTVLAIGIGLLLFAGFEARWLLTYNTLIVMAGVSLFGASAGLVGSYAVLRRRALLGDALSHAALPGVALAFLWTGQRDLTLFLLGALMTGLLGVLIVTLLRRATRIKEDAAIGSVLSVFYATGVVLVQWAQRTTTTGSRAGLDTYILGHAASMVAQDVYIITAVSVGCALTILLLFKEFQVVSFDAGFARVQGWPALGIDLLLTGLIAVIVVAGLPAVGAVLMTALLIIPSAAARFWTDRLGTMLLISSLLGAIIGALGTALSAQFSFSPAGPVIVLTGTLVFGISMLLAPERGFIARAFTTSAFRRRLAEQRLLRRIFEYLEFEALWQRSFSLSELTGHTKSHLTPTWRNNSPVERLAQTGFIWPLGEGRYRLTDAGVEAAARVVRALRLWEEFLQSYPELASSYADLDATSCDEVLLADIVRECEQRLIAAGRWPAPLPKPESQT